MHSETFLVSTLASVFQRRQLLWWVAAGAMLILTLWTGYAAERTHFPALLLAFGGLFLLYRALMVMGRWRWVSYGALVVLGIVLRTLLLFSTPNLSDDVYRFLWDGRLIAQGVHPFAFTPTQIMQGGEALRGITPQLFALLNSPSYYTVYPPVCQGVFWVAAWLFPEDIASGTIVLKVFLWATELLTMWVLWQLRPGGWASAAYALCPLAVLEVVGNAHFEGAAVAFLLVGLWLLQRGQWAASALFWALSVAVKLLPLLFVPLVLAHLAPRARWRWAAWFAACCALLFWPLSDMAVLQHLFSSLQLYFRQFAFNASVYYLLKALLLALGEEAFVRARLLGPLLGALVFAGVWWLALCRRGWCRALPLADRMLLAVAMYLLLSTTVHPWYVLVPFALGLAADRQPPWRFPRTWAAAVVLSYSHYHSGQFQEQYLWIALEYFAVVAAALWDTVATKGQKNETKQ